MASRYDAVELITSSNDNLVTQNVCRLGPLTRGDITVGPGCLRNRVFGNTSVPWSAAAHQSRRDQLGNEAIVVEHLPQSPGLA